MNMNTYKFLMVLKDSIKGRIYLKEKEDEKISEINITTAGIHSFVLLINYLKDELNITTCNFKNMDYNMEDRYFSVNIIDVFNKLNIDNDTDNITEILRCIGKLELQEYKS